MSTNKVISQLEEEQMGKELPEFGPGDTVVVQVKVKEGENLQINPNVEKKSSCNNISHALFLIYY